MTSCFTDETISGVNCQSRTTHRKKFTDSSMQSEPYKVYSRGLQFKRYKNVEVEVNLDVKQESPTNVIDEQRLTNVNNFLKTVEPIILRQLERNSLSKIFRRAHSQIQQKINIYKKYSFTFDEAQINQFSAISMTWNSTGALLGVAYGSISHTDWCTHTGVAGLWNVSKQKVDVNNPTHKFSTTSCLTSLKFHSHVPFLLAGGTFTGELLIWNLSLGSGNQLVGTSNNNKTTHKDSINQIEWLTDTWQSNNQPINFHHVTTHKLVTCGSDGRIIQWKLDQFHTPKLKCSKIYQIFIKDHLAPLDSLQQATLPCTNNKQSQFQFNHSAITVDERVSSVTTFEIDPYQLDQLIVGTETGGLLICRIEPTTLDDHNETCEPRYHTPVKFSLNRQNGPIHSVNWSRFYRNLILACGGDRGIQLFSALQKSALSVIDPGEGTLTAAQFSPHFPNLVVCATEHNHLLFYSLFDDDDEKLWKNMSNNSETMIKPRFQSTLLHAVSVDSVNFFANTQTMTTVATSVISMAFNNTDRSVLVTGTMDGIVHLWDYDSLANILSTNPSTNYVERILADHLMP